MSATHPTPSAPAARALAGRALDGVSLLALSVWFGGYATLGAVVAPLVFGIVPAPASADAMTAVFRRFDSVAIVCAILALAAEAGHALVRARPIARWDIARATSTALAAAVEIVIATSVSPHIERLHREGAIRGLGAAGLELDSVHHLAESLAKVELGFLFLSLLLLARPAVAGASQT